MAFNKAAAFRLWRERTRLREQAATINKEAEKKYEKLLGMMERNGIRSIKDDETGETITYVAPQPVEIDYEGMIAYLNRSEKGREIIKRCTVRMVDNARLAAECNEGNVPDRIYRKFSKIKEVKPHLR